MDLLENIFCKYKKGIVSDYQQEMTQKMIDEMMSDPNLIEKYAGNKRKFKRDIKKKQKKNPIDESIIQESYAKQVPVIHLYAFLSSKEA